MTVILNIITVETYKSLQNFKSLRFLVIFAMIFQTNFFLNRYGFLKLF